MVDYTGRNRRDFRRHRQRFTCTQTAGIWKWAGAGSPLAARWTLDTSASASTTSPTDGHLRPLPPGPTRSTSGPGPRGPCPRRRHLHHADQPGDTTVHHERRSHADHLRRAVTGSRRDTMSATRTNRNVTRLVLSVVIALVLSVALSSVAAARQSYEGPLVRHQVAKHKKAKKKVRRKHRRATQRREPGRDQPVREAGHDDPGGTRQPDARLGLRRGRLRRRRPGLSGRRSAPRRPSSRVTPSR